MKGGFFHLKSRLLSAPIAKMLGGSVVGQAAIIMVSPFLTRLYSPTEFGVFAAFSAITALLSTASCLSFDRAVTIPRKEGDAFGLELLGLVSCAATSLVLLAACRYSIPLLDRYMNGSGALAWWLIPLTTLVTGVYQLTTVWLVRVGDYDSIALRGVVQGVSQATGGVVLGLVEAHEIGLLAMVPMGIVVGLLGVGRRLGWSRKTFVEGARVFRVVLKRYRRFPLVNTWSSLLNSLGLQLPVLLLAAVMLSEDVGQMSLAFRVVSTPVAVIVVSVSNYFQGTFSARFRAESGGLANLVRRFAIRLFAVGLVPTLVIVCFGPTLFGYVFGTEWQLAGSLAQVFVFSSLVQLAVRPVSTTLVVLERLGLQLCWDVSRLVVVGLSILSAVLWFGSIEAAVMAWASALVLSYAVLWILCLKAACLSDRRIANVEGAKEELS